ncbi:MAG: hypothetical protein L0154_00285, partial [Chloroflexi bacterium]|nr:hypothetical protein [Chloroflexota bacterium]
RNVLNSLRAYRDHMQSLYDEWVFDLGSDPEEMDNLVNSSDGKKFIRYARRFVKAYRTTIESFFDTYVGKARVVQLDDRVEQRLRDLGYLE